MAEHCYSNGLHFSCQRCSHCCRHEPGYVYLSKTDLTNLCRWFKLEPSVFIKKYCRWVPYYDGTQVLCLQEKTNYDCILWEEQCTAYDARPVQCSTYPFWTFLLKSRRAWDEESDSCPGINTGMLHSEAEITAYLEQYETNQPLRRSQE